MENLLNVRFSMLIKDEVVYTFASYVKIRWNWNQHEPKNYEDWPIFHSFDCRRTYIGLNSSMKSSSSMKYYYYERIHQICSRIYCYIKRTKKFIKQQKWYDEYPKQKKKSNTHLHSTFVLSVALGKIIGHFIQSCNCAFISHWIIVLPFSMVE